MTLMTTDAMPADPTPRDTMIADAMTTEPEPKGPGPVPSDPEPLPRDPVPAEPEPDEPGPAPMEPPARSPASTRHPSHPSHPTDHGPPRWRAQRHPSEVIYLMANPLLEAPPRPSTSSRACCATGAPRPD